VLRNLPHSGDVRVFGTAYEAIHLSFARACRRAGIQDFRFHDLRHEATSRFFEKGLNPMQVAAITGHKTLQMLKRYTHLRAEELAKMLG
jgi:integrase